MSTTSPPPLRRFLAPRHWPMWFGLGLLRLLILLPYPILLKLGNALGKLLYSLLAKRRHITTTNLRLCFPELDEQAREKLAQESFQALGVAIFESALAWWASDRRLRPLQRMEGMEHYEKALAQGRGVILLGGHYSTLEISGRLARFHLDELYPIYKNAKNPLFNALMLRTRKLHYTGILDSHDMRSIVRTLKASKTIWYAPDQDFGHNHSVFAPFFDVPTATLLMTMRLAKLTGAPVLPAVSERLPGNQGYLSTVLPALEDFPSGDDVRDATLINATMEAQIRRNPAQYLWAHRRFKTRPAGEPAIYDS
ncbi:MAG: LpxL/LpxP family Kdo(2)-lipid IV(A) lauroyl/palmitoleoyl acyltransferase [Thiohalomonadaceae bacterium]